MCAQPKTCAFTRSLPSLRCPNPGARKWIRRHRGPGQRPAPALAPSAIGVMFARPFRWGTDVVRCGARCPGEGRLRQSPASAHLLARSRALSYSGCGSADRVCGKRHRVSNEPHRRLPSRDRRLGRSLAVWGHANPSTEPGTRNRHGLCRVRTLSGRAGGFDLPRGGRRAVTPSGRRLRQAHSIRRYG